MFARKLIYGAHKSTDQRNETRKKDGRDALPPPSLTIRDVVLMIRSQNARCAYLDIPLVFETDAHWEASLERMDREREYSADNCVVVVGEVNTAAFQWSREFADKVFGAR